MGTWISFVNPDTGIEVTYEINASREKCEEEMEAAVSLDRPFSAINAGGSKVIIPRTVIEDFIVILT